MDALMLAVSSPECSSGVQWGSERTQVLGFPAICEFEESAGAGP